MTDRPDYILDISSLPAAAGQRRAQQRRRSLRGRPWLAMQWRCCSTYSRIYRNAAGDAYEGRCPKCQRYLRVPIAPDGTDSRFFEAY